MGKGNNRVRHGGNEMMKKFVDIFFFGWGKHWEGVNEIVICVNLRWR
jgi:hypothetical protein